MSYFFTVGVIILIIIVFVILYKIFKFLISLILIVVFLLIAYITNPSDEEHLLAVQKKAREENVSMTKLSVHRDDYYVFSLTHSVHNDDRKLIGAGAFTQVLIFRNP
jgi:predicted membrane protein